MTISSSSNLLSDSPSPDRNPCRRTANQPEVRVRQPRGPSSPTCPTSSRSTGTCPQLLLRMAAVDDESGLAHACRKDTIDNEIDTPFKEERRLIKECAGEHRDR